VILYALEGEVPSVVHVPVHPVDLIDAVPVPGEYDGAADGVRPSEMALYVPVPLVGAEFLIDLFKEFGALVPAAEGCGDRVYGKEHVGIIEAHDVALVVLRE